MKNLFLYGYDPSIPQLMNKTIREQVSFLLTQNITGVFGGYQNPDFVNEMHEQGLKVYASFKCFAGVEEWEKDSQSRPIKADGSPLEKIDWYGGLNPAHQKLQEKKLHNLERLLDEHDIDGIWFDFIRWPCKWEKVTPDLSETSFDKETVDRFLSITGLSLKGSSPKEWAKEILELHDERWRSFRCSVITDWLEKATAIVNNKKPIIPIGLFTVPWINEEFDNGLIRTVGQDIEGLSAFTDIFSPMVYHKICHRSMEWINDVNQWYRKQTDKTVWPIIQSVDVPNGPMARKEYWDTLKYSIEQIDSTGIIIFNMTGHFAES